MKKILVLCTASDKCVRRLIGDGLYAHSLTLVIPEQRKAWVETDFPGIELFTTKNNYIDYYELRDNQFLKSRLWDEVWILSSGLGSCWDYTDGLCVVSELKYKKMCFTDAYGNTTIYENNKIIKLSRSITDMAVWLCFRLFQKINKIKILIMGYKW